MSLLQHIKGVKNTAVKVLSVPKRAWSNLPWPMKYGLLVFSGMILGEVFDIAFW